MAKTIATIGGVALAPGVSKNRRWYKPEHVRNAVARAQERIKRGDEPMVMLTHHAAGDDSRAVAARLTGMSLDEDGNARYTAAIADTPAGRDLAALTDTSDGAAPHLKGVSIRGYWLGTVSKVKGPDGEPVETSSGGVEIDGLDFTRSPGVTGAQVDTFAWADRLGRTETTERVAIYESVQEARVTITEETGAPAHMESDLAALAEAMESLLPVPHILDNGTCLTCEASPPLSKRGSGLSGAGRQWADPGYQPDKKQRYDISTKQNAKSAWAYVNQPDNAKPYTPGQLKRIKGKIKAALKRFGVTVADESADWPRGETYEAAAFVAGELAEHYGDESCVGSWSITARNGPVSLCLSSYGMDPADLDVILRAAADAACKALAALDPDMDGDIDLPGAPSADTDGDGGEGEAAPDPETTTTETVPADPAATTETEDPAVSETTNPAGQAAPGIDPKTLAEAVAAEVARLESERRERKAAKRAAQEKAQADAARIAAESAALGQGTPATAGATATETADQRRARLAKLVNEQFAAAAAKEGLAVAETDEQIVARMLEEKLVPLRQARAEAGGVQRKGLAALESIADSPSGKVLQGATNDELKALAGAAFGPKGAR